MELYDPNDKVFEFVLWVSTIEPSMYQEIERFQELEEEYLDSLGPFLKCYNHILTYLGGSEARRDDRLPLGRTLHDPSIGLFHRELGYFCKAFMLFRVCHWPKEVLEGFMQNICQ